MPCRAKRRRVRCACARSTATSSAATSTTRSSRSPTQVAVVHCGAGIRALRYRRFAAFLAESGIPTLSLRLSGYRRLASACIARLSRLDRGLGGIRLRRGDRVAARERYPRARIVGIAHSIGALLVGGAPNSAEQSQLVLVGGHTGYYGDYHPRYRLPMTAVWHALMPAITLALGYFPARRLGLGEDLPARVALQWAGRRTGDLRPSRLGARLRPRADLAGPVRRLAAPGDAGFGQRRCFCDDLGNEAPAVLLPEALSAHACRVQPGRCGYPPHRPLRLLRARAGATLWPRLTATAPGREPGR